MASRLCPFCMKMSDGDTCPHCGKNINYAGQPLHLPAGFVVSGRHPYVLGAALGQGGFGITYIALDMVTNTRVAIKEYFPTHCSGRTGNRSVTPYQNQAEVYRKGKERFLDEARTLQSLSDLPSIVNVLDYFEANNSAYLVMEFLEGISMKEYAAKNGKFPARKFLNQLKPLMEDIHRMHERGVIHRDIAPDNIMLLPDGRMKLIDFGAARSYVGDKSMTMVVKKGFAPVEQYLSHGSTASTDVYALAATIYYCTTGKVPPDSADRQYTGVALASPVSLGAEFTPQQEKAILKAMKVQQKERTQTVKDFMEALYRKRRPVLLLTPRGKKLLLLLLAALAAILLLVGIYYYSNALDPVQGSQPPDTPASEVGTPAPQQTEGEEKPATEPAETEASGKSSQDKPASNKPSSGGSSSGGSSSGSGSSSGNTPSSGDSPAPTAPADRPSYDDPVPDDGYSGGNSSDNDSPANNPPADQPVSPPATSPSNPEPAPPPTTGPAPGGSSSGGDTTGGSSSGGSNTGSGSSSNSWQPSDWTPSFTRPSGGSTDSGSAGGDSSGY